MRAAVAQNAVRKEKASRTKRGRMRALRGRRQAEAAFAGRRQALDADLNPDE